MSNRRFQGAPGPSEPYELPPSLPSGVTVFDMILPPQVLPLLLLLLIITPVVLLTAESLFVPLFEWSKSHLAISGETRFDNLPAYFFIKLAFFMVLSFLGGFQLLLRIKSLYYTAWARAFPRPHPLHVDYEGDPERGIVALIQWKLYQAAMIVLPPLVLTALTFIVGVIELYLFNTFSDLSFIGLSLQITIELFIMMMLGLFTFIAFVNSLWTAVTTLFGDVIAVTEPDLPNPIILQRCGRIAFASPCIYGLFPAFFLLMGGIIAEVVWLLGEVDIQQFIRFEANVGLILGVEVLTLACYLAFNFFKFYTYHHGLMVYYHKLPPQLKECFTPPPPFGSRPDMATGYAGEPTPGYQT